MNSPSQEELEQLFQQVRPDWRAEADQPTPGLWFIQLYDEAGHPSANARFDFVENPLRLEWGNLTVMPAYQGQGVFTGLYPLLGPWLQRYGFEWIIVRDWIDPEPFTKRGFILRDDPAGIRTAQVLAIDLRDPDRPSREWVEPPVPEVPAEEVPADEPPSPPKPEWLL